MIQKFKKNKKIKKKERVSSLIFSSFLLILILVMIGYLAISNWRTLKKRAEYKKEIELLKAEIQKLERDKEILTKKISQYHKERYLEKEAREKLGLKKPGENVVVVLPPQNLKEKEKPNRSKKGLKEKIKEIFDNFFEKINFW